MAKTPPMTEEQLEWISEQTERATRKALRHWARRATVGFVVLAAGIGAAFYNDASNEDAQQTRNAEARKTIVDSGRAIAVEACNRDYRTTVELRAILDRAARVQKANFNEGTINRRTWDRLDAHLTKALIRLRVPDCREAREVLTQNPDERIIIPAPLYPKDG